MEKFVKCTIDSCKETDNRVLDVASGMGGFLLQSAEKSPDKSILIGIDVSEKPLRGAMNKAKNIGFIKKFR